MSFTFIFLFLQSAIAAPYTYLGTQTSGLEHQLRVAIKPNAASKAQFLPAFSVQPGQSIDLPLVFEQAFVRETLTRTPVSFSAWRKITVVKAAPLPALSATPLKNPTQIEFLKTSSSTPHRLILRELDEPKKTVFDSVSSQKTWLVPKLPPGKYAFFAIPLKLEQTGDSVLVDLSSLESSGAGPAASPPMAIIEQDVIAVDVSKPESFHDAGTDVLVKENEAEKNRFLTLQEITRPYFPSFLLALDLNTQGFVGNSSERKQADALARIQLTSERGLRFNLNLPLVLNQEGTLSHDLHAAKSRAPRFGGDPFFGASLDYKILDQPFGQVGAGIAYTHPFDSSNESLPFAPSYSVYSVHRYDYLAASFDSKVWLGFFSSAANLNGTVDRSFFYGLSHRALVGFSRLRVGGELMLYKDANLVLVPTSGAPSTQFRLGKARVSIAPVLQFKITQRFWFEFSARFEARSPDEDPRSYYTAGIRYTY